MSTRWINEFQHELLVSCPSEDKVDKNMAFVCQLQISFPEAIPPDSCAVILMNNNPSFLFHYKILQTH